MAIPVRVRVSVTLEGDRTAESNIFNTTLTACYKLLASKTIFRQTVYINVWF